jgi:hypothetical protein
MSCPFGSFIETFWLFDPNLELNEWKMQFFVLSKSTTACNQVHILMASSIKVIATPSFFIQNTLRKTCVKPIGVAECVHASEAASVCNRDISERSSSYFYRSF